MRSDWHDDHVFSSEFQNSGQHLCCITVDCERSLLSAGLDFQACERKGGTADNTSRNEIRVAQPRPRPSSLLYIF